MLEHSTLLVHGWRCADASALWTRAITDAFGQPLGFVRFEGDLAGSWFSWLRKVRLDVRETEDASHLMTVARAWGVLRAWDVHDADDHHVGIIAAKTLVTPEHQRLGFLDFSAEHGRILDPGGQMIGKHVRKESNVEVTFMPQSANPFLRMLMLGSILTLDAVPEG